MRAALSLGGPGHMRQQGARMNRRDFLRLSTAPVLLPVGRSAWAALAGDGPKRLVVIFLRGAIDGINVVVPYDEKAYYDVRPTIAIGRPGTDGGVLPLDGRFGLHPALLGLCHCGATRL